MLVSPEDDRQEKENLSRTSLGKVIFTRSEKFTQSLNGDRIYGFIREINKEMVSKGDNLVLFHREQNLKFYVKVLTIKNYPISAGGFEKKISEVGTHLDMEPFLEVDLDEEYRGLARPHDLSNFEIAFPSSKELADINQIPKDGLPLGKVDTKGSPTTFYYPLVPEDTIFQSALIAGVQGSGKTNFTKLLIQTLQSKTDTSIVVLDAEGEYKNFTKLEQMTPETQKFLKNQGIKDVEFQVLRMSHDIFEATASMSVKGINLTDILQLLPDLEPKSADILTSIAYKAYENIAQRKEQLTWANLKNEILSEANSTQYLSGMAGTSIKQAIARALYSMNLRLFDQPGKMPMIPENIFKPNTVTIIDYQQLSVQQQRMVALYMLLVLYKYKFQQNHKEPGVLLFIDESELLFPLRPSNIEREYVQRIENLMREPVKRGRKHKYGIVPITHLPSDISKGVADLCNTKIAFKCAGASSWIRANFGKLLVGEIEHLPTGQCRINTERTAIQMNVGVKIPFVGDKEDNYRN